MNELTAFGWAFLIPLLPWLSFAIIGLFVRHENKRLPYLISIAMTFCSFGISLAVLREYLASGHAEHALPVVERVAPWITFSTGRHLAHPQPLVVDFGILLDPISILLALIVSGISLLVQIYSVGYMHEHGGYRRFYAYISLFTGAMLGLVLSSNLLQTYIFWELVGLGSFLLIGFYYEKKSAVAACKKAFIVTRFADLGFLLGVLLLSYYTKNFDYLGLVERAQAVPVEQLKIACLLIAMGAFGKSAMFPLHIWLPDAMEGPTPVSALIHAATMVVAGVYLIARLFGLFLLVPQVLLFVGCVGAFTALFAGIIACTQNDIKRILAFSTLSQIGYMMLALGVATTDNSLGYTASMFHLTTHAFFKALLFLGAGAIIHAVHTNNIWEMGGLRKQMPLTHLTFLIGCLAITALPPYLVSGFYSKDEILLAVQSSGHPALFLIAFTVAALTALYMFRLYFVVFWGEPKHPGHPAHDAPASMTIPLVILAILSIVGGWIPVSEHVFFGSAARPAGEEANLSLVISAIAMSLLGFSLAYLFYRKQSPLLPRLVSAIHPFYIAASRKFYIDEVYLFITKRIIFEHISKPLEQFDRGVVDGSVDNVGQFTVSSGAQLRLASTGKMQSHMFFIVLGMAVLVLLLWMLFARA